MSDTLSKVIALIIAVLLLYIFPVENMLTRQDDTTRVFILNRTTEFVDSVRNLGYITPLMYMQFTRDLASTGNLYNIEMEHRHISIDPVYTDPDDITSFQHDYGYNSKALYTDEIIDVLFPETVISSGDCNYYLSKGDTFTVRVSNKNKTMASRIQEMLYLRDLPLERISVRYGGMVRDENN